MRESTSCKTKKGAGFEREKLMGDLPEEKMTE